MVASGADDDAGAARDPGASIPIRPEPGSPRTAQARTSQRAADEATPDDAGADLPVRSDPGSAGVGPAGDQTEGTGEGQASGEADVPVRPEPGSAGLDEPERS